MSTPLIRPERATVCAPCNQKGGVGKTSLVCLLARAAWVMSLRVLVIDADPQGNTTATLSAADVDTLQRGLAEAIHPEESAGMADVIVPTDWPGVDLVPTPGDGVALSNTAKAIDRLDFGREFALRDALLPLLDQYDLVLIDTTPALGRLLLLALAAANVALPVTQPELWSADGLDLLHQTIDLVAKHHNPGLISLGPVVNQVERNNRHLKALTQEIRPYYGPDGWTSDPELIPRWTSIPGYIEAASGLDQGAIREQRLADVLGEFVRRILLAGREVSHARTGTEAQ